ncbi:hypothetical protein R6Q59_003158 [Mikania micrantha]
MGDVVRHVKVRDVFDMGGVDDQVGLYSNDVPELHTIGDDGEDGIDITLDMEHEICARDYISLLQTSVTLMKTMVKTMLKVLAFMKLKVVILVRCKFFSQILTMHQKIVREIQTIEGSREHSQGTTLAALVSRIGSSTLNNSLPGNELSSPRSHDDEGIVDKL